jgi:hypothetical protein
MIYMMILKGTMIITYIYTCIRSGYYSILESSIQEERSFGDF